MFPVIIDGELAWENVCVADACLHQAPPGGSGSGVSQRLNMFDEAGRSLVCRLAAAECATRSGMYTSYCSGNWRAPHVSRPKQSLHVNASGDLPARRPTCSGSSSREDSMAPGENLEHAWAAEFRIERKRS